MPLTDPFEGSYNNAVYGVDQHAAVADQPSVLDSISNVVTKGIPLTGLSIVNSFANTAADVGNFFGGDNKRLSVEDEVGQGEMLDYYKSHEQGIEFAGLAAGSLIPGTIAVKALKLAQAGRATSALTRITGVMSGPRDAVIEGALKDISNADSLFNTFQAEKIKAIALGVGDQALQGLVFETATVATMKASPLLDDDGYQEVIQNVFTGALVGGGIGGVIEGIGIRATINRALLNRDVDTKFAELATYLEGSSGKAYGAGDKVIALLDSVDALPRQDADVLVAKKSNKTYDSAVLNSKKILTSLVGEGDNELTNSMFDVMLKMKNDGMDKEEMYGYFAKLSKVSRIDEAPSVPAGNHFYVNNYAKGANPTEEELVSKIPGENATLNRAYRLREFSTEYKTARYDDMFELGDMSINRYTTAQDAFNDGADIFLAKDSGQQLRVYVNPKATNLEQVAKPGESRPLSPKEELAYRKTGVLPETSKTFYGAPLTLNVKTGAINESAVAVVGDYGAPKLTDAGLLFGERHSNQSLRSVTGTATDTIDANARFVWASLRGVERGDKIISSDLPMLEQLNTELQKFSVDKKLPWNEAVEKYSKLKGVTFEGDVPLTSQEQLLNHIRDTKDTFIAKLTSEHPDLSSSDIALRANVPEDYLANNLAVKTSKDFLVDPADHASLNHVKLEYDLNNVRTVDGQIARGMIDTQYRIQLIKNAAKAQGASFFGNKVDQFIASMTSGTADIRGAGAGAFSFSNSAYNSLGQQMERIGKYVTDLTVKRMAAVSDQLLTSTNAIRDDAVASAELGNFIQVRRMTSESYSFLPANVAAAEGLPADTVVLSKALVKMKDGTTKWIKDFTPPGDNWVTTANKLKFPESEGLHTFYSLSPKVANFERANMEINNERILARNGWYQANGINRTLEQDRLYAPPIDTKKYPHFALVKARAGQGMADDSVAVITAKDAADLEEKIASLRDDYSVFTKSDIKKLHEVQGDYDFNRNFLQTEVNNSLQRRGILNNIFPDTRSETIIRDYVDWHSKQESRLVRDHVELVNNQLFAELRAMGERYASTEMSKTGLTLKDIGRTAKNPYDDYVKTALGISTKEEYRLWADANDKIEAFFSTAFNTAKKAFVGAQKGLLSYEEASAMSQKFGLGNVYEKAIDGLKAYTDIANKLPPERYLSKFVSAANSVLAATAIRLDVFQSIINAVSTPVLLLAESQSATKLLTTELPDGTGRLIPASSKAMFKAVANYFDPVERGKWLPTYQQIGAVREKSSEYFEMINELSLPFGKLSESDTLKRIKNATDIGAKLTGSELSEQFGRYIAADVGRQIFEAAGYEGQQLTDNISTFVNRVHGNYIASQRPVAFQGPIGQAIGLFQTYQFNLFQQIFRYVENKEATTLATLFGMQTSLFGLQGLPGFQAINNHIIGNAAGNPSHKDAYGTVPNLVDKKAGDYLLYGSISNWLDMGLYSRGDINPRQLTILPTNPLDYPAVAGGIKFIGNLLDMGAKIAQGGSIPTSLMLGLEHNGLSRPLTGLAQLAQGFTTTSQGSLISTTRNSNSSGGMSDLIDVANFSRLLGARPLDEAVVMDALYRKTLYMAKDTDRIRELGQAVRTTLYDGSSPSEQDLNSFSHQYAAGGGRIENFSRKMTQWSLDSNASVANQLYRNLKNPQNQQIQIMMGGIPLPDFQNQKMSFVAPDLSAP